MPSLNHIHSLRKLRKQATPTFTCNNPKCSWKSQALLIEGKQFQCNYCSNLFIYQPSMVRTRFPHCPECTSGKVKPEEVAVGDKQQDLILNDLLGGMELDV